MILASGFDNVNGQTLKDFCIIVLAFLMAATFLKNLFRGNKAEPREISPQPLQVEAAKQFVQKSEFEHHVQQNDLQFRELKQERHQDAKAASDSRRIIYDKIDELRAELHGSELRINTANEERAGHLHDRINEVLGEVKELRGEVKDKTK